MFNNLLSEAGIASSEVLLLKHHTEHHGRLTPYQLWRENAHDFEQGYQRTQDSTPGSRTRFGSKYWASFVCPMRGEVLFVGLFRIGNRRPVPGDWKDKITGERPGSEKGYVYDLYDCEAVAALSRFRGELWIDWGKGREWRQRAAQQNKVVVKFAERDPLLDQVSSQENVQRVEIDYLRADPERKERLSNYIERGPVGGLVKNARQGRCQLCQCQARDSVAFRKLDGTPFAEAHHVFPVSKRGSLGAANIMVLCPNHHREVHHGDFQVIEYHLKNWRVRLRGLEFIVPRTML